MGENSWIKKYKEVEYPVNCYVQFDFRVLDLFETLAKKDPLKKRMKDDYFRIKAELGKRPTRLDMYEGSDIKFSRNYLKTGWLDFLRSVNDLTEEEKSWLDTPAEDFLRVIERTSMTKSYKIPTIGALLTLSGNISMEVSISKVGKSFMDFYVNNLLHQKDLNDKSNRSWRNWGVEDFTKLARKNPVHFLSRGKFFNYDEINKVFSIDSSLKSYLTPALAEHVGDILEYKRIDYFRKRYREDA